MTISVFPLIIKLLVVLFLEVIILRNFFNKIRDKEPDRYFTLLELKDSNSLSLFLKYFLFRLFPFIVLFLVNYRILPLFLNIGFFQTTLINFATALIELLFTNLKGYRKYRGLNLSDIHLLISVIVASSPLLSLFLYSKFGNMVPTTQGIIDNIWSAIIIYGILSLFLFSKNKPNKFNFDEIQLEFIARTGKYRAYVQKESEKHNADSLLVLCVLFYELKQRPKIMRFLERIFTFLSKKEVTQGVMQYKTSKLISDFESIQLAIKDYFSETSEKLKNRPDVLIEIIQNYNPSTRYTADITNLYYILKKNGM